MLLLASAVILLFLPLFVKTISREICAVVALAGFLLTFIAISTLWNQNITGFNDLLILDNFAIVFNLIFLTGGALTVLISLNRIEDEYANYGELFALIQFAVLGMMIMVSSNNLLVIFLGLETLSIALYVLAGFRKMRLDSVEASLKYFLLGAFATGFLLYGIALWYGAHGTLELTGRGQMSLNYGISGILPLASVLLILTGLAFKAAFVPFHMWTPDVYQGSPTPVTAFMSTATKAAAFAVLIRLMFFSTQTGFDWSSVLSVLAILTMTIGNILAIQQDNVKRMLAYSSIAHAGYLLVAMVAANESGQHAILYYLIVYTFMNLGAFGIISYFGYTNRQENLSFDDYSGLGYRHPFAALAMSIFMFGLAGIPPTGGFMAKFYVFSSAVNAGYIPLVVIGVLNSVISVYYYLRVVIHLYMREPERETQVGKAHLTMSVALLIAIAGVLYLGIMPADMYEVLRQSLLVAR